MLSMRTVVQTYLKLQRLEVFLAVLLPFFLIIESALANGTVYAGGHLDFTDGGRSIIAFGRGLFFEILTYACAKFVKLLLVAKQRKGAGLVGLVAFWCIVVSAGNNLGWVLSGGEFVGVFSSMGRVMPGFFMFLYQAGLGLLLPISVGVLALVDVSHLVRDALHQSDLDEQALYVNEQESRRQSQLKAQKKAQKKTAKHYEQIFEERALRDVERAKKGDFSSGSSAPGVTKVQPALPAGPAPAYALPAASQMPPQQMRAFPLPQQQAQQPPLLPQQPPIQGQVSPASPIHSGNTHHLNFGPQPVAQPQPVVYPYQ